MHTDRRKFFALTGTAFGGLLVTGCAPKGSSFAAGGRSSFGALQPDPAGVLDLPPGFSYRVLSRLGDAMDDGGSVPDRADGMGSFDLGKGKLALVRNHELHPGTDSGGAQMPAYDTVARSLIPLPGGTTTIVLDANTLEVEREYRSLSGTIRNCAGGVTPWNSWLSCEENTSRADGRINQDHGYVFEVPADHVGLVDPVPLRAMGRFNHEAAVVDPATGYVYQTEDRDEGVLYRFLPKVPGKLAEGGKLQAMVIDGLADTRNWNGAAMGLRKLFNVSWVDLDDVEAPKDDLRKRAAAKGAAVIARGEGMHMGDDDIFICSTSGGVKKLGQIFRLVPGRGKRPDRLELFFESESADQFNFGDNLCVAPNGHLIVCEDQYTDVVDNHLRGITPDGRPYAFARLRMQTELAGGCFSPDGKTFFVNAYAPTRTLAIAGPWTA